MPTIEDILNQKRRDEQQRAEQRKREQQQKLVDDRRRWSADDETLHREEEQSRILRNQRAYHLFEQFGLINQLEELAAALKGKVIVKEEEPNSSLKTGISLELRFNNKKRVIGTTLPKKAQKIVIDYDRVQIRPKFDNQQRPIALLINGKETPMAQLNETFLKNVLADSVLHPSHGEDILQEPHGAHL